MRKRLLLEGQTGRTCGFTLTEILVVIAIIAMLAALLFPIFARARRASRSTVCLSNLRQIGIAARSYENDYDDQVPLSNPAWIFFGDDDPRPAVLQDPLSAYGTRTHSYRCPEAFDGSPNAADRHHPRFAAYDVRFTLEMKIPVPSKKIPGAVYYNSTTWRMTPESSTVIAYCRWHTDNTSDLPPHIVPLAIGNRQHGGQYAQVGAFQALRADGSAARVETGAVEYKVFDYAPFDKGYDPMQNGYDRFPGETWPPKLTKIGEYHAKEKM